MKKGGKGRGREGKRERGDEGSKGMNFAEAISIHLVVSDA